MGFWGAHTITRPLLGLRNALTKLTQGESVTVPHLDRDDEIGDMAQTAEAFRKVTQQVAHDHWIAENVTALTHAISVETRLHAAASNVLHLLCQQLEIPVGAIYLLGAGGGFQRVAAHGLARRSQAEDDFALGEGLVGQCAKDQQVVVLSPVPSGLSIISTGLAEFPPHELVLYPLVYKDKVIGVLEFAVAQSLTPLQHDFLHTVSTTLGLHLSNLQAAEHNLVLLAETRTQSQELTAQQESLLKNNEEMRALSEELRSQSEEMKTQNEELKANQEEMRAQQEEMRHKNKLLESQSTQLEGVLADVKRKAQDLARANQYKSEFLANMSHELRTPLNSVLILSKDLAENETHNLTPEQVESASVISDSGMQLLTLINDILDLSKIESGKLELLKESFQLHELLTYLRRLFTPQIEKKQLNLHIDIADGVAETITTDRQRLVQILSNLLSNAIKFTDKGTVSILVSREGESLQFAVTDTGIGIPADKLDHIFGSFQQLDGSTSRKYGGSGLGLTISRQLARLLGGEIDVTSQLGKGSCFVVRLFHQVADVAPPVSPVAAVTLPVATVQGNILVVEDDARLLAILARMVKTLGFSPLCVESAEQALAAIAREKPLGILLDLGLPKMSGMALLRHLKADTATANLPVYIMSGSVDDGEAKLLGALGFLKKPLTRETLEQAINSLLAAQKSVKRILLVDENPAETEELQHLFQHDACQLISADAGQNALQLLEAQHFDAVILGLSLPDMTGFAWLKQAQHLLNPPPVVVYSADALSEAQVFELKERVESIVTKNGANERLHEEVLLAAQMGSYANKMKMPNNEVFAGKKLLLVDDDARNLFALTRVLRSKGFVIEVAADAVHALAMLNQTHFDALLTDIMMPEMDGYALIRQVRALGYHALPIIAITAKAMQGDDALCLQAGATAYLPKPVDVASLLEILKKV
jgi:signal transduction histidine kinase/CheY-like chemotaxis protein